jgi:hypothetical protein
MMQNFGEPSITLAMIIEKGFIPAGSSVYASSEKKIVGVLNTDGSITIELHGKSLNFPYPSGAARAIEKRSLNGWLYWKIKEGENYRDLDYYRNKYMEIEKKE